MRCVSAFIAALLMIRGAAVCAANTETQRLLLPIIVTAIPGAGGTLWDSTFRIHNIGPGNVGITPQIGADHDGLAPGITVEPSIPKKRAGEAPGEIVTIIAPQGTPVALQLVLRELNHLPDSAGVEIPIVREEEFGQRILLIGVPTRQAFRTMLRIYQLGPAPATLVRVRILSSTVLPPQAVLDTVVDLRASSFESEPGYAQLSLDPYLALVANPVVDVHVDALDSAMQIWGFVSVTSNTSQAVTLITPQ